MSRFGLHLSSVHCGLGISLHSLLALSPPHAVTNCHFVSGLQQQPFTQSLVDSEEGGVAGPGNSEETAAPSVEASGYASVRHPHHPRQMRNNSSYNPAPPSGRAVDDLYYFLQSPLQAVLTSRRFPTHSFSVMGLRSVLHRNDILSLFLSADFVPCIPFLSWPDDLILHCSLPASQSSAWHPVRPL